MAGQLALDTQTETLVCTMAGIVREMVAAGFTRLPSAEWLAARMDAAPFDPYARAVLEALHTRLLAHGGSMLDAFGLGLGLW